MGSARRDFLRFSAASAALSGMGACSRAPQEQIVPQVRGEPRSAPGLPLYFATAHVHAGYANGILVQSHDGRPTKAEGNPRHPASRGATDVYAQASVLELWDPARSQTVLHRNRASTWDAFVVALGARTAALRKQHGAGLALLTRSVSSPSLAAQLQRLLTAMPQARWYAYEPIGRRHAYEGTRLAFGRPLETRCDFSRAETIVAFDADFLADMPGALRHAADFAAHRRPGSMSRLYAFESAPGLTGASADHRFALRASRIEAVVRSLARRLGIGPEAIGPEAVGRDAIGPEATAPLRQPSPPPVAGVSGAALDALAADLIAHRGAALVLAGEAQPPAVHLLVHQINDTLDSLGRTVDYSVPVLADVALGADSIEALSHALADGAVDTLLILDGNPVYDAPADLRFGERLRNARFSAQLGLYADATADASQWHVPAAHGLESWSDARAYDGTVTILQPLIAPLYNGRSAHELLGLFEPAARKPYDLVRDHWRGQAHADDFERLWQDTLHDGVLAGTRLPAVAVRATASELRLSGSPVDAPAPQPRPALPAPPAPAPVSVPVPVPASIPPGDIELRFVPDPSVWDGRYAANGWLQELPRPLTKIVWGNAALLSPATARLLDVASEDLIELRRGGRVVQAPVWVLPGHADGAITLPLGYGEPTQGIGFDAQALRSTEAPFIARDALVRRLGARQSLATTQRHHRMHGREPARALTLASFQAGRFERDRPPALSLYPPVAYDGYKWGMAIDLNACIGCNACTIACQAENNIPIVGKSEVERGREMHWIRVDAYRDDAGGTRFQPVPCMHCENAPCEVVCPVAASVHDDEGLNVQVYNRCIGTRFCSNNCPYKVRRFNWLEYASADPALMAQKNPQVTVRERGVMEKCNYCVQRIAIGRIEAEKQQRRIRDGEVISACAAACPTQAIVFGDLNDPASAVNRAKANPLNYALLGELNTRPRTTYAARLSNPNPRIDRG